MTIAFRKNRIEIAEVNASLENSIAGVRVARAFTGEQEEAKNLMKTTSAMSLCGNAPTGSWQNFSPAPTFDLFDECRGADRRWLLRLPWCHQRR